MTIASKEPDYSFRGRSLLSAAFAGAAILNFARRAIKTSKITSYVQSAAHKVIPVLTVAPLAIATSGCIVPNSPSFEPRLEPAAQASYYVVPIAQQLNIGRQTPAGITLASTNQEEFVSASLVAIPKVNFLGYLNAGAAQESVNRIADTLTTSQAREDITDCMDGAFGSPLYKSIKQNNPDMALGALDALTHACVGSVNMKDEKLFAAQHRHGHRSEIKTNRKAIRARQIDEFSALGKIFAAVSSPQDQVLVASVENQMQRPMAFVGPSSDDVAAKILKRALKNPVEILPTHLTVNNNLPAFDAAKATLALPKHAYLEGEDDCGLGFRTTHDNAGVKIRDVNGGYIHLAKDYNKGLPHSGYVKIMAGSNAANMSVSDIRQKVTEEFGDDNHPIAVVFTKKNDPTDAGHVLNLGFIGAQKNTTYSGFEQSTPTGLKDAPDHSYNVYVYTGPVVNYDMDALNRLAQNTYKAKPIRHVRYTQNFAHSKAATLSMKG